MSDLYAKEFKIVDGLSVAVPTVGEILDDEENYYSIVHTITATPYDMMVQLDDVGVDFSKIDDYDLFLMSFGAIAGRDTHLVFGSLDMSGFHRAVDTGGKSLVLHDDKTGITIDQAVYFRICAVLRRIHGLVRVNKKPANEAARKYMIQRARIKQKRRKNKYVSQLDDLIVALVNVEGFHYDFDTVRDLSIYQFNRSSKQIFKKIDYDNRMHGIVVGMIDPTGMAQDELTWVSHDQL